MKKEDFISLGLSDEVAQKAVEAVNETLKGFVPKHRFDEVNTAKKALEKDVLTRDKQLEELKNSTGDVDTLKETIKKLQDDNKTVMENHKAELQKIKREAIDAELLSNAINKKTVAVLLDEIDQNISDEQYKLLRAENIKKLQTADDAKHLFKSEESKQPQLKGVAPANSKGTLPSPKSFEERLAEARKNNNTLEAIQIKQEASKEGVSLI